MKRWILVLALLLSLGLNLGVFGTLIFKRSQARRAPTWNVGRGAPQLEQVADRLQLAGAERLRFVETQRQFVEEIRRGARRLAEERLALRKELGSARPERERVEELVQNTGRQATELDLLFTDNVLLVREMLDDAGERRYLRFLGQLYSRERGGPTALRRRRGRGR